MNRLARLRRPLAALFAATAAWLALLTLRPGPPPSVRVLAAARDLPAGATLTSSDVRPVSLPPGTVPSGALRSDAAGRVLAGPMRRGEPLTDARLLGDALLRGYGPDKVATPVRISDPETVRLVRPGDRIDVLAAPPTTTGLANGPLTESHGQPQEPTDRTAQPARSQPTSPAPATGTNIPSPTDRSTTSTPPPAAIHETATRTARPRSPLVPAPTSRSTSHELTGSVAVHGAASPWSEARVVVSSVPVITVPPPDEKGTQDGALIVLATTRPQALALAGTRTELSVTITAS